MGAAESAEAAQEELAQEQGAAVAQANLANRQRLLGEIEATLLPLYLVLAKLSSPVEQHNWTPTKTPLVSELPDLCNIVRVCRTPADQWILFANQVAAWLFYNQPAKAQERQARALVADMIRALEAWTVDLGADMSAQVRDWEQRLAQIDQQSQEHARRAVSAAHAASKSQRPVPTSTIHLTRKSALKKSVKFAD